MKTTLLITVFNRASLLRKSLDRLMMLTVPDEVLIVDDGSSDNVESVCYQFHDRLPIKYIYNHNPQWSICSLARNIGVKNCVGDVIITAEPEMIFVTDVIKQLIDDNKKYPQQVISAGTIYHAQIETPNHVNLSTNPKLVLHNSIVENYEVGPREYDSHGYVKIVGWEATFIALYEKKWLMDIGGWDEEFKGAWGWDDVDLSTRLSRHGISMYKDNEIEAIHQYHSHLPPAVQGQASLVNEKYLKDKHLDMLEKMSDGLIANKGKEWGVIIPKT